MTMLSYKNKLGVSANVARTAIKILSNSNRFSIMKLLLNTKKDLCVHELSEKIGISQSATSHQLAFLEAHGVVRSVRAGKTICYLPTNSTLTNRIGKIIKILE